MLGSRSIISVTRVSCQSVSVNVNAGDKEIPWQVPTQFSSQRSTAAGPIRRPAAARAAQPSATPAPPVRTTASASATTFPLGARSSPTARTRAGPGRRSASPSREADSMTEEPQQQPQDPQDPQQSPNIMMEDDEAQRRAVQQESPDPYEKYADSPMGGPTGGSAQDMQQRDVQTESVGEGSLGNNPEQGGE